MNKFKIGDTVVVTCPYWLNIKGNVRSSSCFQVGDVFEIRRTTYSHAYSCFMYWDKAEDSEERGRNAELDSTIEYAEVYFSPLYQALK